MRRQYIFSFAALTVLAMVGSLFSAGISTTGPVGAMVAPDPAGVVPISPCVVLDSQLAAGGFAGPYVGGQEVDIETTGPIPSAQGGSTSCGVPSDAPGVVVDITAIAPSRAGNIRAYPTGNPGSGGVVNFAPLTPELNNSNAVILPVSALGKVSVFVNTSPSGLGLSTTHVQVTVLGYLDDTAGQLYTPVTPCAFADSRSSSGVYSGPYVGNAEITVRLTGSFPPAQGGGNATCNVPSGADGALVNLVALNAVGSGRVGMRPSDQSTTTTYVSYAQVTPATNNSNAVFVPLSATGELDLFTVAGPSDSANVRAVVLGFLETGDGDSYVPVTPCAAFDSRSAQGAVGGFVGPFNGDQSVTYQITGTHSTDQGGGTTDCDVPAQATAVFMNLVALNSVRIGNLQAYGTGTTPTGGVVNFANLPMNNSNAVAVPLSFDGRVDVTVNGGPSGVGLPTANVRGIVLGYFIDANPMLEAEITGPPSYQPPGYLPASSPITITGFASDDIGVERVDLIITDTLFNGRLFEAGVGQFFFQYDGANSTVEATLSAPGATGTPFAFGPIDLESASIGGSGNYLVTAIVFDADGNQASSTAFPVVTAVPSPPTVTLEAPLNGAVVSDVVTLYGSAYDAEGVESVRVFVQDANSGEYLVDAGGALAWQSGSNFLTACQLGCSSNGTWSIALNGPTMTGRTITVLTISATDWGGSVKNEFPGWSYVIVSDTTAATIDVSVPVPGQLLAAPVDVFGTAFDASGVQSVEVALEDSSGGFWDGLGWGGTVTWWPANVIHNGWANVTWSYNWGPVTDYGTNNNFVLHARAIDVEGNTSPPDVSAFAVGNDLVNPAITITGPPNGGTAADPTTISGTASDASSGVTLVSVQIVDTVTGLYWDGAAWDSAVSTLPATLDAPYHPTTDWSIQVFNPTDGTGSGSYQVTAFAYDGFANTASTVSSFTIDNTDPTVIVTTPTTNHIYPNEPVVIDGSASDNAALGTSAEIRIREDKAGGRFWTGSNWSTSSVRVSVALVSPGGTSSNWSYSTALPGGIGPYEVDVLVSDAAGNSIVTLPVQFAVDSEAPEIEILEPDPGDNKIDPVTFTGTASDDTGLASVQLLIRDQVSSLYFNGSGFQVAQVWLPANLTGNNWSLSNVTLDGNGGNWAYQVSARATDTFAKTTTSPTVDFTTEDQTPPAAPTIVSPVDNSYVTNPVSMTGTATDDRVVDTVQLEIKEDFDCGNRYWNGTAWQATQTTIDAAISSGTGTGSVSWTYSASLGSYNGDCGRLRLHARAVDLEGNISSNQVRHFKTDVADPVVTLINPVSGSATTTNVTVSGTVSDDVTLVQPTVTYQIRDVDTDLYWDGAGWVVAPSDLAASTNFSGNWTASIGAGMDANGSGFYKVTAFAVDVVGNTDSDGSNSFYFLPSSGATSIDSSATFTARPITFSGSAHDVDGIDFVEASIRELSDSGGAVTRSWNGTGWTATTALQWFTVPTTGNPYEVDWSYLFQPGEASTGVYSLRVRRVDDLANVSSQVLQEVAYQPNVLNIALQFPADSANVPAGSVLFAGRATSDIQLEVEIRIKDQSGKWLNPSGVWQTTPITLATTEVYQGTQDWDWSTSLSGSFTPGDKYEVSARATTNASQTAWTPAHLFNYG